MSKSQFKQESHLERRIFPDGSESQPVSSPVRKVPRKSRHLTSNPKISALYNEYEDDESYLLKLKSQVANFSSGSKAARSGASFEEKTNPKTYFEDIYQKKFQHIEMRNTPYGNLNLYKMTGDEYIIYFFPKDQLNIFYKIILGRLYLLKQIIVDSVDGLESTSTSASASASASASSFVEKKKTRLKTRENKGNQNTTKNIISNQDQFWKGLKQLNSYFHEKKIVLRDLNRIPDEAYIVVRGNEKSLKILEKKFQNTHGSADQKLGLGDYFKYEYQKMFPNFKVDYAFCVNNFLYERFWTSSTVKGDNFRQYNESIGVHFFNAEEMDENKFTYYDKLHEWLITS
jgi:hypothetical protein